jgi:hypothetical protein
MTSAILAATFDAIARAADDELARLVSELIAVVDAGECEDYEQLCLYYTGQIKAAQGRKAFAAALAVECAIG